MGAAVRTDRRAILVDFEPKHRPGLGFVRYLVESGRMAADLAPPDAPIPMMMRRGDPGDETTWDPASAGSA